MARPKEFKEIILDIEDGIATLTLNRPEKMNAFTGKMMQEMIEAFDITDADDSVRVVIVTGHGERAFCAGADLSSGAKTFDYDKRAGDGEAGRTSNEDIQRDGGGRVTLRIFNSLKPVIGAINGAAVGIGVTMQLPMDIRIAADTARFGFVFKRLNLIRGLTVMENVMLPAAPLGEAYGAVRARAQARLASLGLADKAEIPVEYLSGGETQRVAIARALINDAAVLIADEPTANLDSALADRFLEIVAGLRGEGRTIIMTSHDPRIWGAEVVDRVVEMRDGRVVR